MAHGTEDEDDGLGFYHDGVKRTLTDEQIAIFRHSELEALRRDLEKRNAGQHDDKNFGDKPEAVDKILHEHKESPTPPIHSRRRGRRKELKPDLRKRTWDVVEVGLDFLEYDDL